MEQNFTNLKLDDLPDSLLNNPSDIPVSHGAYNFEDIKRCPVFDAKTKKVTDPTIDQSKTTKCPFKSNPQVDSEDEPSIEDENGNQESTQTSGCPVKAEPTKMNPNLELVRTGHDLPYISKLQGLFGFKGIFDMRPDLQIIREKWDKYPIYLKHTVFCSGSEYETARNLEIGHRFFVCEKLKERGNARFRKGHYKKALGHYETSLSLVRWLHCNVDMDIQPFESGPWFEDLNKMQQVDDALSTTSSDIKTKFKVVSDTESEIEEIKSPKTPEKKPSNQTGENSIEDDEWLKSRHNRLLMTTFHDNNIVYHNGEDIPMEKATIDMRVSILFNLYLCMSVCYMKMRHFKLAERVLEDAQDLSGECSMVLYRKAMAISSNLDSNLDELHCAKELMVKAEILKNNEKIFDKQNMLHLINLHNYKEAYLE